jgi:DNA-binding MarR family transcriptional regulator
VANPATLADQCAKVVMETVPPVMRVIREEVRRRGAPHFSIPQLRTLAYLHRRPGACLFHLAEHLGVSRPTASSLVARLVRRGMVARGTNPEERRRVALTLTPVGARHFRRARQSAQAWMAAVFAGQSPTTLRCITEGLSLLNKTFGEASNGNRRPREAGPHPREPAPGRTNLEGNLADLTHADRR